MQIAQPRASERDRAIKRFINKIKERKKQNMISITSIGAPSVRMEISSTCSVCLEPASNGKRRRKEKKR